MASISIKEALAFELRLPPKNQVTNPVTTLDIPKTPKIPNQSIIL